jgi:hypothetical protein
MSLILTIKSNYKWLKWIILLTVICIADVVTTIIGIQRELIYEANPIMAWSMNKWGFEGFVVFKLIMNFISLTVLSVHANIHKTNFYIFITIITYLVVYFGVYLYSLFKEVVF